MRPAAHTILVTGAAGFIGSAVAARLARMGHRVAGCDNFNPYYDPRLKAARVAALLAPVAVPCCAVELADSGQVADLFARIRPTLVVHLAAQAGVRHSLEAPATFVQSNLVAFGHVLEACRNGQIGHLLYASSSSVYGAAHCASSEHDATDQPHSLYAATKKANELMAHAYSHLYGLPATGMRLFTVYGPWGRPDMACFSFTEKMFRGEPIALYSAGRPRRDFTYIDDIVESAVRLLFRPAATAKAPHRICNIGSDRPVRVLRFVRTLERVLGVRARIEVQPMHPGDVVATHANTCQLREWVNYQPSTPLEAGLEHFREWYNHWSIIRPV